MADRLALGTAQWGMQYGIANEVGRPSAQEVDRILAVAAAAGIRTIDTARSYGESEALIGAATEGADWRILTKLDPSAGVGDDPEKAVRRARESLAASRTALRRDRLAGVLLHRPADRVAFGGVLWHLLMEERDAGRIDAVGVSATTPAEAVDALRDPDVQVIQVAASLLDRRLLESGFFDDAAERACEVFVRSIFLQGAAYLDATRLPTSLSALADPLRRLDVLASDTGFRREVLFIAYARERLFGRVIIGSESSAQLQADIEAWSTVEVPQSVLDLAVGAVGDLPDEVLDPWRWPAEGPAQPIQRQRTLSPG